MSDRVILWDFDGTLGQRPLQWRGCLMEVLDAHEAGHAIEVEAIRPYLRDGFPWHAPEVPHPELSRAEAWWGQVEPLLVRCYEGVGFETARARALARLARERYVEPSNWALYEDAVPALVELRRGGWRHVILSNHVPELGAIVAHLGLSDLVERVVNSAEIGYEKPHPEAFARARAAAGGPRILWMVGDNPVADVAGAEAAGIPAILIQRGGDAAAAPRTVTTLADVARWVAETERTNRDHGRST